jgi:hypothetical protein
MGCRSTSLDVAITSVLLPPGRSLASVYREDRQNAIPDIMNEIPPIFVKVARIVSPTTAPASSVVPPGKRIVYGYVTETSLGWCPSILLVLLAGDRPDEEDSGGITSTETATLDPFQSGP